MSIYMGGGINMLSNGTFVEYGVLETREEVYAFVNEKDVDIFSNQKDYRSIVDKLVKYKDLNKKNYENRCNIYAHTLKIMIPYEVTDVKRFTKDYVETIDIRFKNLLWLAHTLTEGNGRYVYVVLFTRYAYKNSKTVAKTYNRDFYYDSKGKMCSKDTEGAILKAKKGDTVKDADGNVILVSKLAKSKESRIFIYKNFSVFKENLRKILAEVIFEYTNIENQLYIARLTNKSVDTHAVRMIKNYRNRDIDFINSLIDKFRKNLTLGCMIDEFEDNLNNLILKLNNLLKLNNATPSETEKHMNDWWMLNVVAIIT